MTEFQTKVILVGLGGATCSGKTTLAKHLKDILPNSVIVHQDDFAPSEELLPINNGYQDWDAPDHAIDYRRLSQFLKQVKDSGSIPSDHISHDHLNKQTDMPIDPECHQRLTERFRVMQAQFRERDNVNVVWGLIDGFLLYWNQDVIDQLDVRFFLRVPLKTLEHRRKVRQVYITASMFFPLYLRSARMTIDSPFLIDISMSASNLPFAVLTPRAPIPAHHIRDMYDFSPGAQFSTEGNTWVDPPDYWEKIVLPAYLCAHRDIFEDGDVERGDLTSKVKGLVLIEPEKEDQAMSMTEIVEKCCDELHQFASVEGSSK